MIKALIVDDELLIRNELKRFLDAEPDFSVVGEAEDGEEAILAIKDLKPHVVFLDIHIPTLDGLKVAHILSEFQLPPIVVFVTAYDQYAIKAFEAKALDYILKPYDKIRFKSVCDRVRQTLESKSETKEKFNSLKSFFEDKKPSKILGHKRGSKERIFIHPNEMLYFHAELTEVAAHLKNGEELLVNANLKSLVKMLDPKKFQRTHKAYIVNLDYVEKASPLFSSNFELILKDALKTCIPLSRRYAGVLKKFLKW
jgi:DNA-binding LytR/AlgR family response regulator